MKNKCYQLFVDVDEYGAQVKIVKQLTNILPACELCGTTFKNNYLLKRHRQNVHATVKKFKCNICEKQFVSLVYLNAHKK